MGFFSGKKKQPGHTKGNRALSNENRPEKDWKIKDWLLKGNPPLPPAHRPVIDAIAPSPSSSDQVQIRIAKSREVFQFSLSKLENRVCPELARCIRNVADSRPDSQFRFHMDFEAEHLDKGASVHTIASFRLFEKWVDTGILEPIVKNSPNSKMHLTYAVLYDLAYRYTCDVLANLAMDEYIAFWAASCTASLSKSDLEFLSEIDSYGHIPAPLHRCVLHYLAADTLSIEKSLTWSSGMSTYTGIPRMDRDLLELLARKINNPDKPLSYPSKETRCRYHLHTTTPRCQPEPTNLDEIFG